MASANDPHAYPNTLGTRPGSGPQMNTSSELNGAGFVKFIDEVPKHLAVLDIAVRGLQNGINTLKTTFVQAMTELTGHYSTEVARLERELHTLNLALAHQVQQLQENAAFTMGNPGNVSLGSNDGQVLTLLGRSVTTPPLDVNGSLTVYNALGQPMFVVSTNGDMVASSLTLTDVPLAVTSGGTNSSATLVNRRIMTSLNGAIVESAALPNGGLLVGSVGASPVVSTIAGTARRILVTNGPGSITLSAPQDLDPTASVTFNALTLTTTPLAVTSGGTGSTFPGLATGDMVYANSSSSFTRLAAALLGKVLLSQGLNTAPVWGTIDLTAVVAGILAIANGGTGTSSLTGNRVLLSNATGTAVVPANVLALTQVISGASTGVPTVTSLVGTPKRVLIAAIDGTLTFSGPQDLSPTDSPTFAGLTLSTTPLATTSGGTGWNTYAAGDLLLGAASGTQLVKLAADILGKVLLSQGVGIAPVWGKVVLDAVGSVVSGILPVANGGTGSGLSGLSPGDLLVGASSSTLAKLTAVAVGNVLLSQGLNTLPIWSKLDLATVVSGLLAVANGGTGATSLIGNRVLLSNAAGTAIVPTGLLAPAQVIAGASTGVPTVTSLVGTTNRVLISSASDGTLVFSTPQDISTADSPAFAGLTLSVVPLATGSGGTGQNTYAVGDLLVGAASSTLAKLAAAAFGNVLLSQGTAALPTWGKLDLATVVSGILAVANGGTGSALVGLAAGDMLYASSSTTMAKLSNTSTNNVLLSSAAGAVPTFGKVDLTLAVSGTLPVANGGSGATSLIGNRILLSNATGSAIIPAGALAPAQVLAGASTGIPTVTTLVGTANRVTIASAVDGVLTFTGPQDLSSADTPSFAGVIAALLDVLAGGTLTIGNLASIVNIACGAGSQTVNFGSNGGGQTTINLGGAGDIINIAGNLVYNTSSVQAILDAFMTLNVISTAGGTITGAASGGGSGIYVAVGANAQSGFMRISPDSLTMQFQAPGAGVIWSLNQSLLTTNAPTFAGLTLTATPLGASSGGTGFGVGNTYAVGDMLYASGATTLAKLAAAALGNVLLSQGSATAPVWGKVNVGTAVVGTLLALNGGTGFSGFSVGDMLFANSATTLAKTTLANGQLLIGSTGGVPVASPLTAGTGIGITSGPGSITIANLLASVGLTMPADFAVANSPLTASGTLVVTRTTQAANVVFAGPISGASAIPTYRALVAADILSLLQGTANQVILTNTAGTIVLSLPQSVDLTATPTFASLALTNGTNQLRLGATAGPNILITAPAPAVNRTYSMLDTGVASSSFVMANTQSFTAGDLLVAASTKVFAPLNAVAAGKVLVSNGVGLAPSYGQADLTSAVTGTLPVANGGTGLTTYATGEMLYASSTNVLAKVPANTTATTMYLSQTSQGQPTWQTTSQFSRTLLLREVKPNNVAGGSGVAVTSGTWVKRQLSTATGNNIPGYSLNGSNQFILPAGTYIISASAPCLAGDGHQIRIRNITAGTTAIVGSSEYAGNANHVTRSVITDTAITIGVTTTFELQHWITTGAGSTIMGRPVGTGEGEVYSSVTIVNP